MRMRDGPPRALRTDHVSVPTLGVYTRSSVRRASGFVLTGNPSLATFREEVPTIHPEQRERTEPLCINVVSL